MGAPISSRDRFSGTPLNDAIREGHVRVIKELLKCGATFDGVRTAVRLCKAAAEGDLAMVQLLIENGADVNKGDDEDRTCLHLAVSCEQITVVSYLLTLAEIDTSPLDKFGGTPLDDAYRHGQLVMATMLQLQGARRGSDMRVLRKKFLDQEEAKRLEEARTQRAAIKKVVDSVEYQALLTVTDTIDKMAEISSEASKLFNLLMKKIQSLITERSSMSKFRSHGLHTFPLNFPKSIMASVRFNKSSDLLNSSNNQAAGDHFVKGFEPDTKTTISKSVSFKAPKSATGRDEHELEEIQSKAARDFQEQRCIQSFKLKSYEVFEKELNHNTCTQSSGTGANDCDAVSKQVVNLDTSNLQLLSNLENEGSSTGRHNDVSESAQSIMEKIQDLSVDATLEQSRSVHPISERRSDGLKNYEEDLVSKERNSSNENWAGAVLGDLLHSNSNMKLNIPKNGSMSIDNKSHTREHLTQQLKSGWTESVQQQSIEKDVNGLTASFN
mmetsp:Transcript_39196/g.75136  ORF Transcript_39196/g.75136 Transcript_39196/m.75136 type:complete len:497 (+) Transcript_39196:156-1646(+)